MGRYSVGLVGESKYQPAIKRLRSGDLVQLQPEPGNKHDERAIRAVSPAGDTVGYLERDGWLTRCILDENGTVATRVKDVVGGGRGRSLGVVLEVLTAKDATEELERRQAEGPISRLVKKLFG